MIGWRKRLAYKRRGAGLRGRPLNDIEAILDLGIIMGMRTDLAAAEFPAYAIAAMRQVHKLAFVVVDERRPITAFPIAIPTSVGLQLGMNRIPRPVPSEYATDTSWAADGVNLFRIALETPSRWPRRRQTSPRQQCERYDHNGHGVDGIGVGHSRVYRDLAMRLFGPHCGPSPIFCALRMGCRKRSHQWALRWTAV